MIFLCLIALKNKTVVHIFFHRSHANGPLCQERLLRFGNVTPDLSSIFFEAAICENCCFMRVDKGLNFARKVLRKWNACVNQSHLSHMSTFKYTKLQTRKKNSILDKTVFPMCKT